MESEILVKLSVLAKQLHEQNSAGLKGLQGRLLDAQARRVQLLKRPGDLVDPAGGDSLGWQAQAIWSNSADAALVKLEDDIRRLELETSEALIRTRASFTKLTGLDALIEQSRQELARERVKKEESSQEALVNLRERSAKRDG